MLVRAQREERLQVSGRLAGVRRREGSEHGGGVGILGFLQRERGIDFRWMEEVAEERRGAWEAAGGQAAPAVAGEGGTEEVGEADRKSTRLNSSHPH